MPEPKSNHKKLWFLIGTGVVAVGTTVILWLMKESKEYDDMIYPEYGVFLSTQALSAYTLGGRHSVVVRFVRAIIARIAALILAVLSLLVGFSIYATRKITRR